MKKRIIVLSLGALVLVAGIYFFVSSGKAPAATYKTARVERGSIVSTVSATGNLGAVVTVLVGTQVSGTIKDIFVDFNSPVKKGKIIAQIDPALFQAQVEQSWGNYLAAKANLEKARVTLADAKRTLDRKLALVKGDYISQSDADAAQTAYDTAVAALAAAEGAVAQNHGDYLRARTNLEYTTIRSPVDGIVISRNVDVGQTVAASFQTPTLFTIAQDLSKMQIETSVDEADISKVREGQVATFTVDSYPELQFQGKVTQVRNAPTIVQNVVTYIVVVGVDNQDLRLKPGMTANVSIEVARKEDVLKIPTAALRFRPKAAGEQNARNAMAEVQKKGRPDGREVFILGKDNNPVPVPIKTGISDGTMVEVAEGDLKENQEAIIEQLLAKKKSTEVPPSMRLRF